MPELPLGALTAAASASGLSVPGMEQEPPMKARQCNPGPVQPWPNASLHVSTLRGELVSMKVCPCCPALSYKQRLIGCACCMLIGPSPRLALPSSSPVPLHTSGAEQALSSRSAPSSPLPSCCSAAPARHLRDTSETPLRHL